MAINDCCMPVSYVSKRSHSGAEDGACGSRMGRGLSTRVRACACAYVCVCVCVCVRSSSRDVCVRVTNPKSVNTTNVGTK